MSHQKCMCVRSLTLWLLIKTVKIENQFTRFHNSHIYYNNQPYKLTRHSAGAQKLWMHCVIKKFSHTKSDMINYSQTVVTTVSESDSTHTLQIKLIHISVIYNLQRFHWL